MYNKTISYATDFVDGFLRGLFNLFTCDNDYVNYDVVYKNT